MAYTGPVKIREGKINELIDLYKRTYKKVISEIETATEAGKINKIRVMARINAELAVLGVDVDEWIKSEISQYYLDGANIATQDLRDIGVNITKTTGYAAINREAIKSILDEVSLAFADGITAISRNARRVLDDALKQQLNFIMAEGKLTGATRKTISAQVSQRLSDEGLSVLVDRGGKRWSFDTYSEMLVRTKAVEARNQGLANRMLASGYDLVQVSDHNSDHPECRRWEGKILSISGKTPVGTKLAGGYTVAGTLSQAIADGLFHPNCEHSINVINPSLAEKTQAYDNPFNKR